MLHVLENAFLKVTASNFGGELNSILSKKDNTEFLWTGDPMHWKYHAPILFPIVGKVKDNEYTVDGTTYSLPQHGLARTREFEMISFDENSITFELKHSEDTLKVYPYKFSLSITYTLIENKIKVLYSVKNLDNKKIYFSIGAHPAFMCPISNHEKMEDYYFEFNKKITAPIMTLNKDGYFTKNEVPFLNDESIINITKDLFENDALVFKNLDSSVISLKSKKSNKNIVFDFNNFPYLGLWSKASGAPFICIEPWFGHADFEDFNGEFKDKQGVLSLDVDKTFSCYYTIEINE